MIHSDYFTAGSLVEIINQYSQNKQQKKKSINVKTWKSHFVVNKYFVAFPLSYIFLSYFTVTNALGEKMERGELESREHDQSRFNFASDRFFAIIILCW